MNRFLLFAFSCGVIGCASPPPAFIPEDPAPAAVALAMEIEMIQDDCTVRVNRPAQVALFEIVPGQGAGLLFPDPSREEGKVNAGTTRVFAGERRLILQHRNRYLQPWNAGGLVGRRSTVVDQATGPTVIVAVACECDLKLDALLAPDGPRTVLESFNRLDPLFAAEALTEAVLPSPDVSWVMARYEYSG